MRFKNRKQAANELVKMLSAYKNDTSAIVLALPRGGVVLGAVVADVLNLPLDVFIVRKLGVPGHEELAFGAIASGGIEVFNENIFTQSFLDEDAYKVVWQNEQKELARREQHYRGNKPYPDLSDKTIIVVDDGVATGATMQAAVMAIKNQKPSKIILAVPVAPPEVFQQFESLADEMVVLTTPEHLGGIGAWYDQFEQVSDREVLALLNRDV
jgi:putative phosphoribosyl transferase